MCQYFSLTPYRIRFLKAGMNIVDLLGILPYFASLILSLVMTATARGQATANYQASSDNIFMISSSSSQICQICRNCGLLFLSNM